MEDKQEERIDFEDLFKEDKNKKPSKVDDKNKKNKSIYTIAFYFITQLFIGSIIAMVFVLIPSFTTNYTAVENSLIATTGEIHGMTIISDSDYNEYHKKYDNRLNFYRGYQSYNLVINKKNTILNDETIFKGELIVNTSFIDNLIIDANPKWDKSNEAKFFFADDSTIPVTLNIITFYKVKLSENALTDFAQNFFQFMVFTVMVLVSLFFLRKDVKDDFLNFRFNKGRNAIAILTGPFIIYGANMFIGVLGIFLRTIFNQPAVGQSANQLSIENSMLSQGVGLLIVSVVVLGPLVEELVFRKAFFNLFSNKVALVVSSLVFGLLHLSTELTGIFSGQAVNGFDLFINALSYVSMGLIFGAIYIKTKKNIIPVFIIHLINNLLSVLMIFLIK